MTSTYKTLTLVPSKQDSFQRQFHSPGPQSPSRLPSSLLSEFIPLRVYPNIGNTDTNSFSCLLQTLCQKFLPGLEAGSLQDVDMILSMKASHCVPAALLFALLFRIPISSSLSLFLSAVQWLMSLHCVLCSEEQKASVPAGVAKAAH